MGHNSVDYIHTLVETAKLAFADREQYYADPRFEDVPLEWLLSKEYADDRRHLINPERASMLDRPGGVESVRLEERVRNHGLREIRCIWRSWINMVTWYQLRLAVDG